VERCRARLERIGDVRVIPANRGLRIVEVRVEAGVQTIRVELEYCCRSLQGQADRLFRLRGARAPAHKARHSRSGRLRVFELTPAARRMAAVPRDTDRMGGFRFGDRLATGAMTCVV
jgi:hypothetical protein